MWRIALMWFAVCRCGGVEVAVGQERVFAPLFEEAVLQCQYFSSSSQPAVVQWWFKSFCRDRTADAFGFPPALLLRHPQLAGSSQPDCADTARTVRIIASIRGSASTLTEHYRDREDISIINQMDLRIGRLQWGDSGVYQCKVVISDDPEGTNEAQVELLVLGKAGALDDFLPGFDLDIMPDWLFLALVVLGGGCCLLLVGVCWCQCCPHSCCCYLPCCCCRRRCCCPQHLYEAGKVAGPEPLFISGVPTMLPITPPSMAQPNTEKAETGASSLSELSCFPDTDSSSQSGPPAYKTAAPPLPELWVGLSSQTPPPPGPRVEEHIRWNPRSEHLQRKPFSCSGRGEGRGQDRAGSLDELEEFALSYTQHGRRGEARGGHKQKEGQTPQRRLGRTAPKEHALTGREGRGQGDGWGVGETPTKSGSSKSSDCYLSISPSNQPKERISPLPPCHITGPPPNPTHPPRGRREEVGMHRKTVSPPPIGQGKKRTPEKETKMEKSRKQPFPEKRLARRVNSWKRKALSLTQC